MAPLPGSDMFLTCAYIGKHEKVFLLDTTQPRTLTSVMYHHGVEEEVAISRSHCVVFLSMASYPLLSTGST